MGRKAKSTDVSSKNLTKEQRRTRKETEELLKGEPKKLKPSSRLNSNQKKIFNFIADHLDTSKLLGELDEFILETACIAIDRLQTIERTINTNFDMIMNKELMAAKTKYSNDFFKCCNELSLSPQSRAKFGIIATQKKEDEQDPLLKVLNGGK